MNQQKLRLGSGAGFSADRLDPALHLIDKGGLDAIIFETIGERTLAFGHRDRQINPDKGFNPWLEQRLESALPLCAKRGTRIMTNMGVANPRRAAERSLDIAKKVGVYPFQVATLIGDDVTELITPETELPELTCTVGELGLPLIGANAYLGVEELLPAVATEASMVMTGRVADPSLFLALMVHAFGWQLDDWSRLGAGTLVGHLLECSAQITGGYFADPPYKTVKELAYVGFPLAEISSNGQAVITKLPDSGGHVTLETVKEQLLYEIHDPAAYLTPDVTADFSTVRLTQVGKDRVQVEGASGQARPENLKVTVGFDGGFLAEGEISYAGPGAEGRARLAGEVVLERMTHLHHVTEPIRVDLIGVNALHGMAVTHSNQHVDVRLRIAIKTSTKKTAKLLLWEVESLLTCGPAGGGGFRGRITPSVLTYSAFIARNAVTTKVEVLEA